MVALRSAPFSADYITDIAEFEFPTGTTVYSILDRLEEKGFIGKSLQAEPASKRRGRRKFSYDLTASGRSALERSLRVIDSLRDILTRKTA
jgi:DNA-binding PadR family transcriptional regulator